MKQRYLKIFCIHNHCLFGAFHCCNWYVNSIRLVCVCNTRALTVANAIYIYMFVGSTMLCCFPRFSSSFCISWYFTSGNYTKTNMMQEFCYSLIGLKALNSHVPYKDETGTRCISVHVLSFQSYGYLVWSWYGKLLSRGFVDPSSFPYLQRHNFFTCSVDISMFEKSYSCVFK